jgi:hypothetical protein
VNNLREAYIIYKEKRGRCSGVGKVGGRLLEVRISGQ